MINIYNAKRSTCDQLMARNSRTPHSRPLYYITYITYTIAHYTHGVKHEYSL